MDTQLFFIALLVAASIFARGAAHSANIAKQFGYGFIANLVAAVTGGAAVLLTLQLLT